MSSLREFVRSVRSGVDPTDYRPGACNIDATSRRRRRGYAALGAGGALLLVAAVALGRLPPLATLVAFVPLSLAFENWLQARLSFCAWLAALGRRTAGSTDGSRRVEAAADRRADRLQALRLTVAAQGLALATTVGLYWLLRVVR